MPFIIVPKKTLLYDSISTIIFVTNCGNFMATKKIQDKYHYFTWKSIAASIYNIFGVVLICILEKNKPKILSYCICTTKGSE